MASIVKECECLRWWLICSVVLTWSVKGNQPPQVPCYFIFGDSYYDVGNNNFIDTLGKANFPPYGIDFPESRPTGRFSNGRNQADVIAQLLGFNESSPAFFLARGPTILKGVNYASGGAGILNDTGRIVIRVIPMEEQLRNHDITVKRITGMMGNNRSAVINYLGKCLYTSDMGTNDYIANYFLSKSKQIQYSIKQYTTLLIQQYTQQLTRLYNDYGARKFGIIGVNQLGCLPISVALFGEGALSSCVDRVNNAAKHFNNGLKIMVDGLNANLPGANFTFINTYEILDPSDFKISNTTCCKVGVIACVPLLPPCGDRNDYIYWDSVHTTEFANLVFGQRAYNAKLPTDAYPLDLYSLTHTA